MIFGAALVIGLFLGVIGVFIRKTMRHGMDDPELIEKQLYVPVYATVAHSKIQESLNKELAKPEKAR